MRLMRGEIQQENYGCKWKLASQVVRQSQKPIKCSNRHRKALSERSFPKTFLN